MRLTVLGLLIALLLCSMSAPAHAKVRLGSIFQDHMVIQRDKPIVVFGYTEPGGVVGVSFAGQKAVATASSRGRWQVELSPMKAGGPYNLTVVGSSKVELTDVMVGEVWLCSGQSNMFMDMAMCKYTGRVKDLNFDGQIRFAALPLKAATRPINHSSLKWKVMDDQNFGACSSVGFGFARRLHKQLGVPVGVVISAAPGSVVQSWISRSALKTDPQGRNSLKELDNILEKEKDAPVVFTPPSTPMTREELLRLGKVDEVLRRDLFFSSTVCFNGLISPLIPFQFKGVLWYQGESNISEPSSYPKFFGLMVNDWRKRFRAHNLPFLYVQLAPIGIKQSNPVKESAMAQFRQAQAECKFIPYTHMAVTLDCSYDEVPDWHGSDKLKIGHRLALLALSKQYNRASPSSYPILSSHELKEGKVVLHFQNVDKLKYLGQQARGFYVTNSRNKRFWAQALVEGNKVTVWSDKVKHPTALYYAWADNPLANLVGTDGLPVVPFRITNLQVRQAVAGAI